jgi:formylglycine-generating enzyme required for sulfatase activity
VWRRLLFLIASVLCAACTQASAEDMRAPRAALVIGNAGYPGQPLASAANDARAMAATLARRGYSVMHYENLDRDGLLQALQAWHSRLAPDGGNVFYFAGHGIQTGDAARLLGIDAARTEPASLMTRAVRLGQVLEAAAPVAGGLQNMVVLDTCLDNPFGTPVAGPPPAPAGTLVAYATRPGGYAVDDAGQGVFTAALLQAMAAGGGDLAPALADAALRVARHSGQRQQPWLDAGPAPHVAAPPAATLVAAATAEHRRGVLPKDSAEQVELTFWDSVKDSSHASDYEAYLQAYPNGRFAALARARMERLKASAPKTETPKATPAPAPTPAPVAPPAQEKTRPPVVKRPADAPPATPPATPAEPARAAGGPSQLQKTGADIRDCPACPVLGVIAPGAFTMGSNTSDPSEKPPRRVTVEAPFAIGRTEVTVEQWNACVDAGACPRVTDAARAPNTPARDISWDDAQLYVKWLTKVSGKPYRLPTEAEWEYAARGGTSSRYWWGEDMRRGNANCKECGDPWQADGPAPAASFAANAFGLHDMNGSVWEWVEDCWHSSYKNAPADARAWTESFCPVHVIRGGSWRDGASYMPATTRFKYDGSVRHSQNGFRVVRDMK